MDDVARGWAIVTHGHTHSAALVAVMIAVLSSVAISVWFMILTVLRKRRRRDADDEGMRPKQRAPLPGPDRGFRR